MFGHKGEHNWSHTGEQNVSRTCEYNLNIGEKHKQICKSYPFDAWRVKLNDVSDSSILSIEYHEMSLAEWNG